MMRPILLIVGLSLLVNVLTAISAVHSAIRGIDIGFSNYAGCSADKR